MILSARQYVQPTVEFVNLCNRLIRVMTSRISSKALKPGSANALFLEEFLAYLDQWENEAKPLGGGFLTDNTAVGLRVTIKSTLGLLSYLCSSVGFKYLLTSHLSQDKLENLFGIIRQSPGCNDHPTISQFLVSVNALSFYNLARPPRGGTCSPAVVKSLLGAADTPLSGTCSPDVLDNLFDSDNVDDVEELLLPTHSEEDHAGYCEKRSNSALTYYVAGYAARKVVGKSSCPSCAAQLCVPQNEASRDGNSYFTCHFDNGGLIYPSDALGKTVQTMEDAFTSFFSKNKLHEHSLQNFAAELQALTLPDFGCTEHGWTTRTTMLKFYRIYSNLS